MQPNGFNRETLAPVNPERIPATKPEIVVRLHGLALIRRTEAMSDEILTLEPKATAATDSPGPQTQDEARQFHEGFLAGATAYCAAVGHSGLKSENPQLRDVFQAQGWRTLESFEKLAPKPEHEKRAAAFREQIIKGDGKPEGTRESLERCAKMLETYAPECFPANELGQVHFARAMMESVTEEIREFLSPDRPKDSGQPNSEQRINSPDSLEFTSEATTREGTTTDF